MSLFGRLFGAGKKEPDPYVFVAPAPAETVVVIGDVHGRIDLLDRLLETIRSDPDAKTARLVTVGDYVDRGEQSAQVIDLLWDLERGAGGRVVSLKGNHEKMMLDFIDAPAERGTRWLRNGGLQTLASYRIGRVTEAAGPDELTDARDMLLETLAPEKIDWLKSRPLRWESGTVSVAHAAMDPGLPPGEQAERTLMWGHKEFLCRPRQDGRWVVHGHTIFDEPQFAESRISVDTGAYFSGRLTAAVVTPDGKVRFLQT